MVIDMKWQISRCCTSTHSVMPAVTGDVLFFISAQLMRAARVRDGVKIAHIATVLNM